MAQREVQRQELLRVIEARFAVVLWSSFRVWHRSRRESVQRVINLVIIEGCSTTGAV